MHTNRITQYFGTADVGHTDSKAQRKSPTSRSIPKGFVAVPQNFQGQPLNLYQQAYLAAQSAAQEKLLQLLRSRAGLN